MAATPAATGSGNGTIVRARAQTGEAKPELARTLEAKVEQGFTIESETDTRAVMSVKGRRRWFGLTNAPIVRYELTVDEGGRVTSRRI
jgi:hypothetical protein